MVLPDPTLPAEQQDRTVLLAMTLWGESRGEQIDGPLAVGNVIQNRVLAGIYPGGDDWAGIMLSPFQFSCWLENNVNREKLFRPLDYGTPEEWETCYDTASQILDGQTADNTQRSTMYHSYPKIYDSRVSWAPPPYGNPRYVYQLDIGHFHMFRDARAFHLDVAVSA